VTAILSPHLDDAVLSCWSVLTGSEPARVVNVFTGAPAPGSGACWWDRMTGAVDSADRMRERRAEDRAALALAGREALPLGLLEAQYRGESAVPDLLGALRAALAPGESLLAPAAMKGHPDHTLVRDAAVLLGREGADVVLYADLPHAITRGWPTWVAHGEGVPTVDVAWDRTLAAAGEQDPAGRGRARRLEPGEIARKLEAVRAYATQVAALDALAFRPLHKPETLRYEVFWPLG
jgi:LmbE family N-acetylglucosaminyl deacetylase